MTGLTILAAVFAVYAVVAGRLDRLSITAPMVFVVAAIWNNTSIGSPRSASVVAKART